MRSFGELSKVGVEGTGSYGCREVAGAKDLASLVNHRRDVDIFVDVRGYLGPEPFFRAQGHRQRGAEARRRPHDGFPMNLRTEAALSAGVSTFGLRRLELRLIITDVAPAKLLAAVERCGELRAMVPDKYFDALLRSLDSIGEPVDALRRAAAAVTSEPAFKQV
jgi:hypothetical protein